MRVWAIAAALFTFTAGSARAANDDFLSVARRQTFVVQSLLVGRKAMIGSGVVVHRSGDVLTLATAAHLISQQDQLRILDVSRRAYYDVIDVRTVQQYDLAFVRVRAQKDFAVVPAAFGAASLGEPVWLWGNPEQSFWRLATGVVTDARAQIPGTGGNARIAITCQACAHGDSGSGIFDAQGRLLGILTRAWTNARNGSVVFLEVEPASFVELATRENVLSTKM